MEELALVCAIIGGPNVTITDDDLVEISRVNSGWKFERSDRGELIVSPISTSGGAKLPDGLVLDVAAVIEA